MIDFIILIPIYALTVWLEKLSHRAAYLGIVIGLAIAFTYQIGCHARWGRTVGKWIMGIRVTRPDGSPIGLRQALLRSSVEIVLAIVGAIGLAMTFAALADEQFTLPSAERARLFKESRPFWTAYVRYAHNFWILSEVIVLFSNYKFRTIHDYIAGTVVQVFPPAPILPGKLIG